MQCSYSKVIQCSALRQHEVKVNLSMVNCVRKIGICSMSFLPFLGCTTQTSSRPKTASACSWVRMICSAENPLSAAVTRIETWEGEHQLFSEKNALSKISLNQRKELCGGQTTGELVLWRSCQCRLGCTCGFHHGNSLSRGRCSVWKQTGICILSVLSTSRSVGCSMTNARVPRFSIFLL